MYDGLVLANRYRLRRMLGRGGMGEVWEAIDMRLRRPVAVKLLSMRQAADSTRAVRFRREAEINARVSHPSITILYDIGEDQGLLFLVMELLDGVDLRGLISRDPLGLPVAQALDIGIQVAEGLAAAHSQRVVHRDIKPANLIRLRDGTVKICDFGIAWSAESTLGLTLHGLLGTPTYMAPEQFNSTSVDGRTDLYALGCVLQELLTGRPPFPANASVARQMFDHLNTAPTGPRSLRSAVPEELDSLVLDMLAKNRTNRPASAKVVVKRIREILALCDTAPKHRHGAPRRSNTLADPQGGLMLALNELHRQAGEPSTRKIGESIHYSHSTVGRALRGDRCPSWPVLRAIVRSMQGDEDYFHRLWVAARNANTAVAEDMTRSPSTEQDRSLQGVPLDGITKEIRTSDSSMGMVFSNAEFVTQNGVPTTMELDWTTIVSITMRNCGTTTWSTESSFKLGSQAPHDNEIWLPNGANRVQLPGSTVGPGELATFKFFIRAPKQAGKYAFQWRMVQDGVTWFGERTPLTEIAVS